MAETNHQESDTSRGAATSGCVILGAIITVFGGLIVLYIAFYFLQKNAFEKFTEAEPAKIPLIEPTGDQIESLKSKMDVIKAATEADRVERILFTKDDLNTMIATYPILEDCRGTTRVEAITSRGIEASLSRPMRKIPLSPEQWFLNAKFTFWPELRRRTIAMRVVNINPFTGTIPEGFVESYDAMSPLRFDPEKTGLKPYIPKISRIYIEDNNVVVETGIPADEQPTFPREKK